MTSAEPDFHELVTPKYPLEFIESIIDNASDTLGKWLKEHALPEGAALCERIAVLHIYCEDFYRHGGRVEYLSNRDIESVVTKTVNDIARLGGQFGEVVPLAERSC